jgi:hypothetical protein
MRSVQVIDSVQPSTQKQSQRLVSFLAKQQKKKKKKKT